MIRLSSQITQVAHDLIFKPKAIGPRPWLTLCQNVSPKSTTNSELDYQNFFHKRKKNRVEMTNWLRLRGVSTNMLAGAVHRGSCQLLAQVRTSWVGLGWPELVRQQEAGGAGQSWGPRWACWQTLHSLLSHKHTDAPEAMTHLSCYATELLKSEFR